MSTADNVAQFCGVTGAPTSVAKKFIDKYKRVDIAIDAYYNDPNAFSGGTKRGDSGPSTSKIHTLFDKYKDPDGQDIGIDGTIKLCEDLQIDPEDVVMLAVAYELKSPRIGEWTKKGWTDGWRQLGCDSIPSMKVTLVRLRDKLGSDPGYFQKVYNHTFDFARQEGQRSLGIETAISFWNLLLPHGLQGGALAHIRSKDKDEDDNMSDEEGWQDEYTQWWFDYLNEKGGKGISKDTWQMFLEFVRTIDAKFIKYDMEAAWPSSIDDFVEWAKQRAASHA